MDETTITLHTRFEIGAIDPRVFGGFFEHLGRGVYEGMYDPESAHADEDGFRTDVLNALRRLNLTVMRYPGGNFASGYHWLDGVGPREQRPVVRELAWQSLEPNHFGTDEYIKLCRKMGWTPMITANFGTGTPEEARNWVEYCNSPTGTRYANMRAVNGALEPYSVKLWCLGNEMDGPWQLGHVPAREYAIRAQQAAKLMKDVDKSIEVVVCGTSNTTLETYMEWDRGVLEYMGDLADYISLHCYARNDADDTPDYLAFTNAIDRQIEEMDAVCRFVQAKQRGKKRAYLCFDEWNVWYKNNEIDGEGKFAPHLMEEVYNLEDALVVAGFLNSFIRHADAIKIANLSEVVNPISPIHTRGDEMLVQATFYPFEMFSQRRNGVSLRPITTGPAYEGKTNGRVNVIDASAIFDASQLHVFAINRSLDEPAMVKIELADQNIAALASGELLTGPSPKAANSFENPGVIKPQVFDEGRVANGKAAVELPPLSVTAMTFRLG